MKEHCLARGLVRVSTLMMARARAMRCFWPPERLMEPSASSVWYLQAQTHTETYREQQELVSDTKESTHVVVAWLLKAGSRAR